MQFQDREQIEYSAFTYVARYHKEGKETLASFLRYLFEMNPALLIIILCVTEVINCLREIGLGTVNFSKRIKLKILKHMQHLKVKDHTANIIFQ